MIIRYDSIAALRADYVIKDAYNKRKLREGDLSWFNNETIEKTLYLCEVGDTKLVPMAEALLDKLDQAIETPRRFWEASPAGAYCIVPDVLAGHPMCMRRPAYIQDERASITILVTTTSSAGISSEILLKRGVAILALVMALGRVRPVSLQNLSMLDGTIDGEMIITSVVNTAPLDLATACYTLTSAGFDRRIMHDLSEIYNNYRGDWPRGLRNNWAKPKKYYDELVLKLGLRLEDTLIIGASQLGDALLAEPVQWINKQIAHFTSEAEDEVNV